MSLSVAAQPERLPLALGIGTGGAQRAPMAHAVIGGLVSSTLLTLVVVPVLNLSRPCQQGAAAALSGAAGCPCPGHERAEIAAELSQVQTPGASEVGRARGRSAHTVAEAASHGAPAGQIRNHTGHESLD